MNRQDKIIAALIGLALVWWGWHSFTEQKKIAEENSRRAVAAARAGASAAANASPKTAAKPVETAAKAAKPAEKAVAARPKSPEQTVTLSNGELELTLSSHGAVVKSVRMLEYAKGVGRMSEENPPLAFDFSSAPALAIEGVPGLAPDSEYSIAERGDGFVVFKNDVATRRISLKADYQVELEESFAGRSASVNRLSIGTAAMGTSKNDILSIDSMSIGLNGKREVVHHGSDGDSPLKSYLVGGDMGGCGGSKNAMGIPPSTSVDVAAPQDWIAVKSRFFVFALANSSEANGGFRATMKRDVGVPHYALKSVSAAVSFAEVPEKRTSLFYFGPKKQSLLWSLGANEQTMSGKGGMKDVMEFGMWSFLCYPIVWLLNAFHTLIPNFGVGIILLTLLVRVLFWPLTHKSTIGMRKMQEIQPKLKEIQRLYKDNPQRMQQETWQVYRDNKVNPMASCLPMLVQIPVFIALFTVLRSAVELRYAPFLWISDLSEPEALFATWFPFGGLNVLPIAMAGLTMLQSAFTPSTGDNRQQRMMMVMMPLMMLVMFYNFPSALSLYWALSTAFGVVQAFWIKRKYAPAAQSGGNGGAVDPDSVIMPTRQMRRHQK